MIYCSIFSKKITNRGFLSGPYCPIYGIGGLIIAIFLEPFASNPIVIFLLAFLFTTLLEYVTSFLMEKAFNAKWWDYSKRKCNINGRVCLLNSILFGIGGLVITYFVHPYVITLVNIIPLNILNPIIITLLAILLIDFIGTLNTIFRFKERLKTIKEIVESIEHAKGNLDVTNALEAVKDNIIAKTTVFNKRLINSFPTLTFIKLSSIFEDLKVDLSNKQQEFKVLKKQLKGKKKK